MTRCCTGDESGMTVVELAVVAGLMVTVLAIVSGLLVSLSRNDEVQQARIANQEQVRILLLDLARDIRAANPPLALSDSSQYANRIEVALGRTGGTRTYVRWDLAAGDLTRSVITGPQGTVTATTDRLTGVTSGRLFRYFDQTGAEIVAPDPVDDYVNCAIRVRVDLTAAPDLDAPAFNAVQDVEVRNRLPGGIEGC